MRTDKLEQFIRENRDAFDELEPNPAIWEKITKREPAVRRLNTTRILWRVAAVAVIFVSAYIFVDHLIEKNKSEMVTLSAADDMESNAVYQELMEAEFYYSAQIEQRREEFYQLASDKPSLKEEVNLELTDLDELFNELKEDLKDNADNEEVVVAMIRNYRLRLEILEQILVQLKSVKDNKEDDESNNVLL